MSDCHPGDCVYFPHKANCACECHVRRPSDPGSKVGEYTPGPWMYGKSPEEGYFIRRVDSGRENDLATVEDYPPHDAEANARLIAQAPRLLEALDELVRFYDVPNDPTVPSALMDKARAAIEAATRGKR